MSTLQIPRMGATFEQNLALASLEIENGDLSVIDGALRAFLAPVDGRQNGKKQCATTRQNLRPPEGGLSLPMVRDRQDFGCATFRRHSEKAVPYCECNLI